MSSSGGARGGTVQDTGLRIVAFDGAAVMLIRRQGSLVFCSLQGESNGSGVNAALVTSGFLPASDVVTLNGPSGDLSSVEVNTAGDVISGSVAFLAETSWITQDPWPTELPGVAG